MQAVFKVCKKHGETEVYNSGICKECQKQANKKYYCKNREKIFIQNKLWKKRNQEKVRMYNKKSRDKRFYGSCFDKEKTEMRRAIEERQAAKQDLYG